MEKETTNKLSYEDLKKIIESCHLNFLLGSGASTPFLEILGNTETLLTELEAKEEPKKEIIEASIKKHYFDNCIKGNLFIGDDKSCDDDKREDLKTVLTSYSDFIKSLHTIVQYRESNLVSKQVNLFTTNMDLFLDNIIEEKGYVINDGFSGRSNPIFGTENFHNSVHKYSSHYEYKSEQPLFNLFKMHGSVNWKKKYIDEVNGTYEITYDHSLSILNEILESPVEEGELVSIEKTVKEGNVEYATLEELTHLASELEVVNHTDFITRYQELIMINPTKNKFKETTSNLIFYELLRMYANHLEKENSVLFVIGFSFADEHIKEITKRVLKSNPTLLIIIFCSMGKIAGYYEMFQNANNVICLIPEGGRFSLDKINLFCFSDLAHELQFGRRLSEDEKDKELKSGNDGNSGGAESTSAVVDSGVELTGLDAKDASISSVLETINTESELGDE